MDNNQDNAVKITNNEINLMDLIFCFWRHKVTIICSILFVSLVSGIFSIFVLSPEYNSKLSIIINIPETLNTRFGEYELPITSNQQYIQLITSNDVLEYTIRDMGYDSSEVTIEKLKSRIMIGEINTATDVTQNYFEVIVSADNPKEAKKLADVLFENYANFLDVMTKERAVLYYYDSFSVQIQALQNSVNSNKEILKKNEELLKIIPQTINQKDALAAIDNKLDTNDFIVLEDIINPNYTKVEGDIILLKQEINTDENSIIDYEGYLKELEIEKKAIEKYYESGKQITLESNVINIIDNCVYMPSSPVEPTSKTSPSHIKNIIIGALLGGMIGVFAALIKEYWFN